MLSGRVRLKDIALDCGVSATLVSAVLNQRTGRIGCSESTRARIMAAAEALQYRPNLLARSMLTRRVPLVGVMLSLTLEEVADGSNAYFQSVLSNLTFALNGHGLQAVFVPYSTEQEQVDKARRLLGNGLSGGIITNIVPESNRRIGSFLRDSGFPYMILGYPEDASSLYHCYSRQDYAGLLSREGISLSSFRQVYMVTSRSRELLFYPFPLLGDYQWLNRPQRLSAEALGDPGNLFLVMGVQLHCQLRQQAGLNPNQIVLESAQYRGLLPDDVPVLQFSSGQPGLRLQLAAAAVSAWMQEGRRPAVYGHSVDNPLTVVRYSGAWQRLRPA